MQPDDWLVWERMRYALWPGEDETHGEVTAAFFHGGMNEPESVLLLEDAASTAVGFVELSVRTDLPGFEGTRIGYVEGLYLERQVRGQSHARTLLAASRQWAHEQNCEGFASDRDDRVIVDANFRPWALRKSRREL